MGKSCCIIGCDVSSLDVEYFKFPRSGSLLAAWTEATGAAGGDVCSAHFTEADYKSMRGKRRLLGTAVPSVFPKPPSNIENGEIASTDESTTIETINKTVKTKPKNKKAKEKESIESKLGDTDNKIEKTIDKKKVDATDNNEATEKANKDSESSQDSVDTRQSQGDENKKENSVENAQTEVKDIEEMITNYQIKQTKTLADRLNPEPLEDLIPAIMAQASEAQKQDTTPPQTQSETGSQNRLDVRQLASHLSNKLDDQLAQMRAAPVFVEVPVERDTTRAESPQDCVMLLENVQCDIDPSSLMLPEHGPETDSDMEIVDVEPEDTKPSGGPGGHGNAKKNDPISLLTSSDEDDVIIQEPHIDTVEVSDETDEDDRPLHTLIRAKSKPEKPKKGSYEWGFEFYCAQCEFRTNDEAEVKQHNLELGHVNSTTIQICPTCNYTTASKAQFSRHKRKHRDERNFKCHLCNYKARHNMSLTYHLKCHAPVEKQSEKFTCDKCGFSSNVKSEALKHLKLKNCNGNKYACDQCSYSTKRRSDLRRHRMRRHSVDDSDEDFSM